MDWAKQFRSAADRLEDDPNWLEFPSSLDAFSSQLATEYRLHDVARGAMALVLAPLMRDAVQTITEEATVQSPIEEAFLWALIGICLQRNIEVELPRRWRLGDGPERISIQPQAKVRRYRVDFRLGFTSHVTNDEGGPKFAEMFVECDGHDFHERTKEQAAKDRSRDRMLQAMGIPVFRFTGSEIFADPLACARQALDELDSRAFGRRTTEE